MMNLNDISYVCFDFDGVILDTLKLKENGFVHVYQGIDTADELIIRDYQRHNGGSPRNEKFKFFDNLFLNSTPDQNRLDMLSLKLSKYIMEEIESCPFIAGFSSILAQLQNSGMPVTIASAMPETELHQIIDLRGIASSFIYAYGSPRAKSDQLKDIDINLRQTKKGLYFGDTMSDYVAATKSGLEFMGIGTAAPFATNKIPFIKDFTELIITR